MHRFFLLFCVSLFCSTLCLSASAAEHQTIAAEHQIRLVPAMITNETGLGDASLLVDEQGSVGDPAAGKGLVPRRPFFAGWTSWYYPLSVMVDLGAATHLTRLFLYNQSGQNTITVSVRRNTVWVPQKVLLSGYQSWQECRLDTDTRYLRLTLASPISLPEIILYGASTKVPASLPAPKHHIFPLMQTFLGVNAFIDDPVETIAAPAGFVREYHNWSWDVENSDHQTRFEPSAAGGGGWYFDDYYRRLKEKAVVVSPAIQQTVPEYFNGGDADSKPVLKGEDPEEPASYARHAAHLFQFAARYGGRPVPSAELKLAAGQPRLSGMKLLRYIEDWNEPDKTWKGRDGYFTPYEMAAMASADYDGDQGRLPGTFGVKKADPAIKLVMGGLAGLNLDYLRAMKSWADLHRGGSFPADVINFHHYSTLSGDQGFQPGGQGISPESDHLKEKLTKIALWRDQFLPGKELWVTEFGYDTNPKSPLHAPAIGTLTAEQVQGAWLIRSYLAMAAAGVDRAAMFMLRDVNSRGSGVFETCGLVTEKGSWKPKPSWFFVSALKHWLTNTRFSGEVASGQPEIRIYRFDSLKSGKHIYAVWCPTSEDRQIKSYEFPIRASSATTVNLRSGEPKGIVTPMASRRGRLRLSVSEVPLLLML